MSMQETSSGRSASDRILVFVPAYNCAAQIPRVLKAFENHAVSRHFAGLICVDNRSPDDTLTAAEQGLASAKVPQRALLQNDSNYGLGGSHKVAIRYALEHGYSHLVVLHGDDQGSIADMVPLIEQGAHLRTDCLLGARFMRGSRLQGYSRLRTAANHVFNILYSIVSRHRLYDLGSGLNLYNTAIFRDEFYKRYPDDLTFNYFLVVGTCEKRVRHRFFPITWREDDQVSNAKLFRQGTRMLQMLVSLATRPDAYMRAEHRTVAREDYPATVIKAWSSQDEVGPA